MSAVTFTSSIGFPLQMFLSVERKELALAFDHGSQMDRSRPHREQVLQGVLSVVQTQIDSFMPVFEQQFAAVLEITVDDINERLAEVGQAKQQLLFDAFPVAVRDLVDAALRIEVIGEEPFLVAKL